MSDDWCDLCELPRSQCPHGAPAPVPPPAAPATTRTTRRAAATGAGASGRSRSAAPGAASAPRRPSTRVTTSTPVRRTPPGRTPQTAYRGHLLTVLAEHPVAVDRDEVLAALEARMALTEEDRRITADGEVRWRRAVMKERKAMADDGLLDQAGHGLWLLSAVGRAVASEQAEHADRGVSQVDEDTGT